MKDVNLKAIYRKQMFFPGITGLFINPFYFARKNLAFHLKYLGSHITGRTLDIGCGIKPYRDLFHSSEYIGLEPDTPQNRKNKHADYYYDGHTFPFKDGEFDSAVCSQVFEHVFHPDEFLAEIFRILKPEGRLLLTTPFIWDEHEQPFDFARYSSYGLKHVLKRHGFEIIAFRKSTDDITLIFQLIAAFLHKKILQNRGIVNILMTLLFISPVNILGELFGMISPKNEDMYLDNIVLAAKREVP